MNNDSEPDSHCFTNNYEILSEFQDCVHDQALSEMRYMSTVQAAVFTLIYTAISIIGVFGNGLVIFVVARNKVMRTTRNVFIVSLALSNFTLATILVPFLWMPTYRIEFPYGKFMCKVAQAFPGANIFSSTLTVGCIAVDRYYAVVRAGKGPGKIKVIHAALIAALIWTVSFCLSILYLLHFDIKDYTLPLEYIPKNLLDNSSSYLDGEMLLFQHCTLQPSPCVDSEWVSQVWNGNTEDCYKFYETAVSSIMAAFIYVVPMPVLIVFNVLLTRFLKKNERQQNAMRRHSSIRKTVAVPNANHAGELSGTPLLNRRAKKASTDSSPSPKVRQSRSRTTSLLFAMAFSNAVLWLPFTIISLFIQLAPSDSTRSLSDVLRQLDDAAKLVSMLSICVNPFLYGYLNTNFKREFKLIFRKCCPYCIHVGTIIRTQSGRSRVILISTPGGTSMVKD